MGLWAMVCQDETPPADGSPGGACASWTLVRPGYLSQDAVVFVAPAGTAGDYSTNQWYVGRNVPGDAMLEVSASASGSGWGTVSPVGLIGGVGGASSFDVSQLDPTALAEAFGAGFSLVAICLCIGIGAKTALDAIRRL